MSVGLGRRSFCCTFPCVASRGRRFLAKAKQVGKKSTHFLIEVRGVDLVVSLLNAKFKATYYKPPGRPNLILRERTKTDDEGWWQKHFRLRLLRRASWGRSCRGKRRGPRMKTRGGENAPVPDKKTLPALEGFSPPSRACKPIDIEHSANLKFVRREFNMLLHRPRPLVRRAAAASPDRSPTLKQTHGELTG
jgi:hypothetical protein